MTMQSRVIWKYPLIEGQQTLSLPGESQVLSIQNQGGRLCLWADVEPDAEPEDRTFIVRSTGQPYLYAGHETNWHHATVQLGPFVYHVFEIDPD